MRENQPVPVFKPEFEGVFIIAKSGQVLPAGSLIQYSSKEYWLVERLNYPSYGIKRIRQLTEEET
jgi:hypothetical protein